MSFVTDLVSKGISQTGAVEVLLGRPISRPADRTLLGALRLPAAPRNPRSAISPAFGSPAPSPTPSPSPMPGFPPAGTSRLPGRPAPTRRAPLTLTLPTAQTLVNSLVLGQTATWSQLMALAARLALGASTADQQRIDQLKMEIERVRRQLEALIAQLSVLLGAPPASAGALPGWQAMVDNLRAQIAALEQKLDALLAQLAAA